MLALRLDGYEFCARTIFRKAVSAGKHGVSVFWQENDALRVVQPHSIKILNKGPNPLDDRDLIGYYKNGIEINEIEDDLIQAMKERP